MLKFTPPGLTVAPNGELEPRLIVVTGRGVRLPTFAAASRGSDVVGFGRSATRGPRLLFRPPPPGDLRHVVTVLLDVLPMLDQLVADRLLEVRGPRTELRHAVDHVLHEMEPIEVVEHDHVERGRRRPFLLVAPHVDVAVVRPTIR